MQLPEQNLDPWVRWGIGAELRSWLWEDCWGLRPKGYFRLTPASPRGRTCLEWVSSSGDHQQGSRAQGARGSPDPLWPMKTRALGEKKASYALLSNGALGLWLVPRGESTFPECTSPNRIWSLGCNGASVLSSVAGSRVLLVYAPKNHLRAHSCFSTKENTFGVGFKLRSLPARQ